MTDKEKKIDVGGQAVIEGVMMRSPKRIATAVRRPDGEIEVQNKIFVPVTKRHKFLGIPIIRGAASLIEMLSIGISTLNWSADVAFPEEAEKNKKKSKIGDWLTMLIAFAVAIGLFAYLPLFLSELAGFKEKPIVFNAVAGGIRLVLFLIYLIAISFMKDVKRLFEYHGAEHKSIFAFESGEELTISNVKKYTTLHPRCGTSFLLIVALASILFFAIIDALFYTAFGFLPQSFGRFAYHLALWPVMAGVAYEILKLSAKLSQKIPLFKIFVLPGLWLQKITTKEPDDSQIEVAIRALKESLKDV
ncbi:MAG: DUF1385 domain-containing protein [Candidatus Zixiibacteriota bacterium]